MMKKLYTLLAVSSVMACSAAQIGLTVDGQNIVSKDELRDYVVAGCPELTIQSIQQAIATAITAETLTDEQKQELIAQYTLHYVEFMVQRGYFEVLILVDARDNGQISEIVFSQRLPFIAEFEQHLVARIREEMAKLSEAQIAEIKQTIATARKVDVAEVSLQDVEAALFAQEYLGAMQRIAERHSAELADGMVETLVDAVVAALHTA